MYRTVGMILMVCLSKQKTLTARTLFAQTDSLLLMDSPHF
jgi:hypothetical protein